MSPFISNVKTFEQKCAKPIGASWNPQTVFHSMTEPKIITSLGTIIEPMEQMANDSVKGNSLKYKIGKNRKNNQTLTKRRPLRN